MAADEDRILDVAGVISDGKEVDWPDLLARAVDPRQREVIENLRDIAQLVAAHESLHPRPGAVEDARALGPTDRWGQLELRERIGRGSFGEVWRAWEPTLDREVALKLVDPARAQEAGSQVVTEGRLMARVRHPHVVAVFGADAHAGRAGIWMELVRGRTLADVVRATGALGSKEAAVIGMDLCGALAAVHGAGLVHRDVKAENVIREEGGRIVLMDLGAGLDVLGPGPNGRSISGTPLYMAPEVLDRRGATAQSDLYSLGVLLYHLVTGRYPIEARTLAELREAHAKRRARGLLDSRPDLPRSFVHVIERALEVDPDRRFRSAGEMEGALASFLGVVGPERAAPAPPGRALRWRGPLGATLAAGALVGTVALALLIFRGRTPTSTGVETASYDVRASFHLVRDGRRIPLENGARVTLGDRVGLEVEGSRPLFVYVVNEDERGHTFRLFPMPALATGNPIAAGVPCEIPGPLLGRSEPQFWGVDSVGGREHMLVVVSPERLTGLEADLLALDVPAIGGSADAAHATAKERLRERLRGFGVLESGSGAPQGTPGKPGSERAPELISKLGGKLSGEREHVRGVWMRRFEFENPAP